MSSILFSGLSNAVQSLLGAGLQSITSKSKAGSDSVSGTSSSAQKADTSHLSQFAQLMNTLQQLQQSDPAKYQQVMQQIGTNLQSAAKLASSQGNSAAATQLSQLATDFSDAASSGKLPNVQDLAQAVGGGHHHHHLHHTPATASGSDGTSTSSSTGSDALSQIQAAFQSNGTNDDPLSPLSVILSTLSRAGVTSGT